MHSHFVHKINWLTRWLKMPWISNKVNIVSLLIILISLSCYGTCVYVRIFVHTIRQCLFAENSNYCNRAHFSIRVSMLNTLWIRVKWVKQFFMLPCKITLLHETHQLQSIRWSPIRTFSPIIASTQCAECTLPHNI